MTRSRFPIQVGGHVLRRLRLNAGLAEETKIAKPIEETRGPRAAGRDEVFASGFFGVSFRRSKSAHCMVTAPASSAPAVFGPALGSLIGVGRGGSGAWVDDNQPSNTATRIGNILGGLLLAFRHADSPTFEGEAANVALVCAVWGPLIVGKSAVAGVERGGHGLRAGKLVRAAV